MWSFFRRQLNYFLIGFIIAFVIYLFIRYDADDILLGVVIGAVAGVALSIGLYLLERRFPEARTPD
jgi:cell division protein FtsW (lipid II flippase)